MRRVRNYQLENVSVSKKDITSIPLIFTGLILAISDLGRIQEISVLPLSAGLSIFIVPMIMKIGQSMGEEDIGEEGVSYRYVVLLLSFVISFLIIGVIIPFIKG